MVLNILAAGLLAMAFAGGTPAVSGPVEMASPAAGVQEAPAASVFTIDRAHSGIGFAVKHMVLTNVRGRFTEFEGTITLDEKDVTKSSVEFTAKIASINTDIAPRDEHLRSPDFFDAAKYPEMTFKSKKVEKHGDGYVCHGTFTLKGVSKEISIPFKLNGPIKDPRGTVRIGIEATTSINRQDYGLTYGKVLEGGGLAIGNDVQITLDLEAARK